MLKEIRDLLTRINSMGECFPYKEEATGSSPVSETDRCYENLIEKL